MSAPVAHCPACGGDLFIDLRGLRGVHRDSCWLDEQELRVQHADIHDERAVFERGSHGCERAMLVAVGASEGDAARTVVTVRKLTASLRQRSFSGLDYLRPMWRSAGFEHPAVDNARPPAWPGPLGG